MRPSDEAAAFLFKRKSRYYFRYCLPEQLQTVLGRCEIRVSLETRDATLARELVAAVLPHVYALKRLCKRMAELTPEEFKRAVTYEVTRIVDTLGRTREPWRRAPSPLMLLGGAATPRIVDTGLGTVILGMESFDKFRVGMLKKEIERGQYTGGIGYARQVLSSLGIQATEDSELFRQLSLEMMKLGVMLEQIKYARANGDYKTEQEFIDHYRQAGYVTPVIAPTGPTINEAWAEFFKEKANAKPKAEWNERTAKSQQATFSEFKEIVGDIRVNQVTRTMMLDYRNAIGQLPKNRTKGGYRDKSIVELLAMDIPEGQRPHGRTVQDKLGKIGAFLSWCRETKQYLTVDPMIGVYVDAESQSYAPFSRTDLEKLFYSEEYKLNRHSKSWHFWIPLIALYTGARQSEIAQLTVENVTEEDGVWIFVITDAEEGQSVKTTAGVRTVPVSGKLKALGFLDYIEFVKRRGEKKLFPDLRDSTKKPGDPVSRWFGDTYKRNCGIEPDSTGKRKVFHSFRHTAITKAMAKKVHLAHAQQVFGHEKSLLGETGTYTHLEASELVSVIEALDYGLDHSAYKDSWRKYVARWPKT